MDVNLRDKMGGTWDTERPTLGRSFLHDMERLWEETLKMAGIVESALRKSLQAFCNERLDLAAQVQGEEPEVNLLDVQIELDCLRILALHQPVASDLRRVAAILKIDHELERIADLAEHISKRVRKEAKSPSEVARPEDMDRMAAEVMGRVSDCLDAMVKSDLDLARAVIISDRQIDKLRRALVRQIKDSIRRDPEHLDSWLRLIDTARNFERIADHATNIAETVIYMIDGNIVRHKVRTGGPKRNR